jgi:superoxide dismutase, Fe-Mn family
MDQYTLPPLPYAYNALEPHYDEATVKLHHDMHHAAYVKGLNAALEKLEQARANDDFGLVKHWERELAFHGSGHLLHSIFWTNMKPGGGGEPKGDLLKAINEAFGSYAAFKKQIVAAANAVEGSGWAILAWNPALEKLYIYQAEKHQDLTIWGAVPVLVIDVWEHAYYLKYQNKRPDWVNAFFNVVNWDDVAKRYAKAKA